MHVQTLVHSYNRVLSKDRKECAVNPYKTEVNPKCIHVGDRNSEKADTIICHLYDILEKKNYRDSKKSMATRVWEERVWINKTQGMS